MLPRFGDPLAQNTASCCIAEDPSIAHLWLSHQILDATQRTLHYPAARRANHAATSQIRLSSPRAKNIPLNPSGKSALPTRPSHPMRGALRTSRTRGGMRWTRESRLTSVAFRGRRSRVVLAPRCWR